MSKEKPSLFANSKHRDYLCLLGVYIHKRILLLTFFILLLLPVGLLLREIVQTYQLTLLNEREKITYRYDDVSLLHTEGYVILVNEQGEMVYEGEFAKGKCNGQGTVYQKQKKRYVGKLVDNEYEDEKGKYYDDQERLLYEGGFIKGVYEGEGFLYNPITGNYRAQGTFKNGELNGQGIEYYEDGSIQREGTYLYGRLNGEGVSYYEGSNIREYEGEFMGNTPLGEGILYSPSGRAWYQGLVYGYSPDYESFVGATFAEVREHFMDPLSIYTSMNDSAMAIHKQDVIFISAQPYEQKEEVDTSMDKEESDVEDKKSEVASIDETKIFIEAIAIKSEPMLEEDYLPYEQKEDDGVYAYDHITTGYSYLDMYTMMLYRFHDGVTPFDAFIDILETKDEVTKIQLRIPTLYVDRYTVTFHGLCQETIMLGEQQTWSYQIVKEEREI